MAMTAFRAYLITLIPTSARTCKSASIPEMAGALINGLWCVNNRSWVFNFPVN